MAGLQLYNALFNAGKDYYSSLKKKIGDNCWQHDKSIKIVQEATVISKLNKK